MVCGWVRWMQQGQRTEQGNLKKPDRQDISNWVSFSWESVSEEVTVLKRASK